MRIRSYLYKKRFFKTYRLDIPVISIGNLTMGGSGKTPVVMYLAKMLLKNGSQPAVVSRGYGGKAIDAINIVSNGKNILLNSVEAGDEPKLIADSVPGLCVLTGKKRILPSEYAEKELGCNIIILDDGFQHESVKRDTDIVLFNAVNLFSHFHVFPGGFLREPFSALHRANCFCITGCSDENKIEVNKFSLFLKERFKNIPLFHLHYLPSCFVDGQGKKYPLNYITAPVSAFCGIASPQRFHKTLETLSLDIRAFVSYKDHKNYSDKLIESITDSALASGAKFLLTTEKDLVKIDTKNLTIPVLALSMEVKSDPGFDEYIVSSIKNGSTS